jgi:hypothetical protein
MEVWRAQQERTRCDYCKSRSHYRLDFRIKEVANLLKKCLVAYLIPLGTTGFISVTDVVSGYELMNSTIKK